jgi:hypothetical protein
MGLDGKLIDELLAGRSTVAEIAGENGLLKQLTKAMAMSLCILLALARRARVLWLERWQN